MRDATLCYIFNNGKILLQKKARGFGEGKWNAPGGKIKILESSKRAAVREVREETGMILKDPKVFCVNNDKNEHDHFVTIGFLSEEFEGEPQVLEPDEITEWRWFDLSDLPDNMFFPSAKIVKNYSAGKFYLT